jgi:hypothetical protein
MHPFAHGFHIAQVAQLGFSQPLDEARPHEAVLDRLKPDRELIEWRTVKLILEM